MNLLDNVIRFPVMRMFDWLLGGICGLVRGLVVVLLILCILPRVVSLISPEQTQSLLAQSTLYSFISQLDILNVASMVTQLIG